MDERALAPEQKDLAPARLGRGSKSDLGTELGQPHDFPGETADAGNQDGSTIASLSSLSPSTMLKADHAEQFNSGVRH
jgi:hypothetical protein